MSRTFRRLKAVFNHDPYPGGPYAFECDDRTIRELYKAIGDGPKGQWAVPSAFTRMTSTVPLRRHVRRAIHRARMLSDGWDGFTVPRKWPRPYWW